MGIRQNLAALMSHRNISQYALARESHVPQPTIQRILKGESQDPKTETVAKLALYFGVSVEELRGTKSGLALHENDHGLSAEALEVARIWMQIPEARRLGIKESLFLIAVAAKHFPWLVRGRPVGESYEEFEARVAQSLESRRPTSSAPPRSKK